MKKYLILFLSSLVVACFYQAALSTKIETELENSGWKIINLKIVANFNWERVCIIAPYMTQKHQDKIFGFRSKLLSTDNEGISVLAFIKYKKVVKHVSHPRNKGDFLGAAGTCTEKDNAIYIREPNEIGDWVTLVLQNA